MASICFLSVYQGAHCAPSKYDKAVLTGLEYLSVLMVCLGCLSFAGYYSDGYNVYLEGGILFGTIFGGIIFPPFEAVYFPAPIVQIVVFGPVFAQGVFIVDRRPFFCQTPFYNEAGVRIFNPRAHCPETQSVLLGHITNKHILLLPLFSPCITYIKLPNMKTCSIRKQYNMYHALR